MQTEIEKIRKRLIKKSEKNNVPYYHELMKFKINIEKGFQKGYFKNKMFIPEFLTYLSKPKLLERKTLLNKSINILNQHS